jgi:catechol 2,3-dioxygenase-like lactoylglutathione lyase family enzyme
MRIRDITLTVRDLAECAAFYRDVLEQLVDERPDHATVRIGPSRLVLRPGEGYTGVHHLAFGVSPHEFVRTHEWLGQRVKIWTINGSEVFAGPPGWNSRSLYFFGPEEMILEYIAHDVDAAHSVGTGPAPNLLGIYEIGRAAASGGADAAEDGADDGVDEPPVGRGAVRWSGGTGPICEPVKHDWQARPGGPVRRLRVHRPRSVRCARRGRAVAPAPLRALQLRGGGPAGAGHRVVHVR